MSGEIFLRSVIEIGGSDVFLGPAFAFSFSSFCVDLPSLYTVAGHFICGVDSPSNVIGLNQFLTAK
jgi:hypothetical protein